MRVLFLTLYPDIAASPRYRVGQFLPSLRAAGIACDVSPAVSEAQYARLTGPGRRGRAFWYHAAETPRRVAALLGAGRYDAVFVQKALASAYVRGLDALLRARARRVVYDIDDAVHLFPPHSLRGVWKALEDPRQVRRLMGRADAVLAGNRWLAEEAEREGGRAELFPTVVDTDRFTPPDRPPDTFRIGWIGGPSTTPSLHHAPPGLDQSADAELCLVGADPARVPWKNARVVPWSAGGEVALLQSFTAGIMPLPKTEWTRGKCALKALQYMACGVPCIATPFGAVCDIIRHGENGLFADSAREWHDCVARLRDPAERAGLGEAARATVERDYSLKTAAPRLREILERIA
jgi:glycosyltransferase involved in cell wall biosynthesis